MEDLDEKEKDVLKKVFGSGPRHYEIVDLHLKQIKKQGPKLKEGKIKDFGIDEKIDAMELKHLMWVKPFLDAVRVVALMQKIFKQESVLNNWFLSGMQNEQMNARKKCKKLHLVEGKKTKLRQPRRIADDLICGEISAELKESFKRLIQKIVQGCKEKKIKLSEEWKIKVNQKKMSRLHYKAFYIYGAQYADASDGALHLFDGHRCSFSFSDFASLYECFDVIFTETSKSGGILRCKDTFNQGWVDGGYRHLLLNVYAPGSEYVCEIQLHHDVFFQRKHELHETYKEARLFDTIGAEGNLVHPWRCEKDNGKWRLRFLDGQ
eukprot:CAMPEP_0202692752 /NCGR_PEP_ID=MMETSP1385-20130828/7056_1 /ASSEMBLY_ACC=CAM_ASM_000861 /TAXON_ID=933848 /ORGANISM="Elphidium margaritaceum" /LENGTH=320 /DNA_ID=CAMNT_0049348339 /DNA_START=75 /DNA_END=1037 /DNA_ORIENTATION=+